jgi:NarL family two-component system sensor histidine kinase YdfH
MSKLFEQVFSDLTPIQRQQARESRPFFIIVLVVMVALYTWGVSTSPALRDPFRFIAFTVLMTLTAFLPWLSPYVVRKPSWVLLFLFVQGSVAFVLSLLAGDLTVIFGVYTMLIGLAVGMLRGTPYTILVVAIYLGLAVIDLFLTVSASMLIVPLATLVPIILFVVIYVTLYSRQAEARAQAQLLLQELETAHKQLATYAAQVEDLTLANERERMARELHDTLAQGLAGLILQLEAANSHLSNHKTDRAQAIIQQAMSRARSTLTEARRVIDDLRVSSEKDFSDVVRDEVTRFTQSTGLVCHLDLPAHAALPDPIRDHALRILSESLTNIAQHAKATQAWVNVHVSDGAIEIEVRDDGVGFDPHNLPSGHYGLLGMRERARLAGGRLDVTSKMGEGTTVKFLVEVR